MTELQYRTAKLKSGLKKLRILLVFLTIIQVVYVTMIFVDTNLWIKLDLTSNANWLIWGFHYLIVVIFLWYNWKKMPIEKKTKTNNTFMIIFLGIIGMWLWLPNKRELNKLTET